MKIKFLKDARNSFTDTGFSFTGIAKRDNALCIREPSRLEMFFVAQRLEEKEENFLSHKRYVRTGKSISV